MDIFAKAPSPRYYISQLHHGNESAVVSIKNLLPQARLKLEQPFVRGYSSFNRVAVNEE